ncbi:hypothetical protein trd_A0413 (plasmid) [Thermomicrobium roseum DSM 5159]|uniref:Uncharacterized protein n=1 Tax=Thermomicrobium roseum (strain ATCC 27502 / DSM 5159 / P-2) TaxID=309801 RepID=B9L3P9_THERP|nr:hypothetical protein trd_A0413 [Thermomicrobium roseum DSM 5159]
MELLWAQSVKELGRAIRWYQPRRERAALAILPAVQGGGGAG